MTISGKKRVFMVRLAILALSVMVTLVACRYAPIEKTASGPVSRNEAGVRHLTVDIPEMSTVPEDKAPTDAKEDSLSPFRSTYSRMGQPSVAVVVIPRSVNGTKDGREATLAPPEELLWMVRDEFAQAWREAGVYVTVVRTTGLDDREGSEGTALRAEVEVMFASDGSDDWTLSARVRDMRTGAELASANSPAFEVVPPFPGQPQKTNAENDIRPLAGVLARTLMGQIAR
jgi:hypothetical protein